MGKWTGFEAWDARDEAVLREEGWDVSILLHDRKLEPPLATFTTTRFWHAIHVGLTGLSDAPGEPPASLVVWRGEHLEDEFAHESSALHVHSVETVRKVAAFLVTIPYETLERQILAARAAGVWIYSESWSFGPEADGGLRRAYEGLVAFYQDAAERGWVLRICRC